jgi:hypothetical protein
LTCGQIMFYGFCNPLCTIHDVLYHISWGIYINMDYINKDYIINIVFWSIVLQHIFIYLNILTIN